ncbi:uncharacterized protein TRAVEDRAFT_54677 [Trametes versicolor FP-101664 SS1]|uniref:F-box domain-containing protein n=1 Tax=Trametes versicolor (strain FP-101664) TaxID=717944 RepID=R7S661_TRAVS|nr:uncharacterized protein TRAVEDRAFT_54677 [Trametes versicolor FP-101664 SS1]EIW51303.1 hypothetical protein TRAVEDRAFT_54677 [Trametes versicolor FP-101664 SS1]
MRIVTRKQHIAFEAAQAVPLQAGKRIRTLNDLHNLLSLATFSPNHAAFIDSLDIILLSAFLPSALRATLASLPNLTDLILIAPRLRNPVALRGIHLPQLQYFRTDLSHVILTNFLAAHPHIMNLDLVGNSRHCDVPCPLQEVDFRATKSLSGPACCAVQIAPSGLTRLTMDLEGSSTGPTHPLRMLDPPLPGLYALIVDIRDDDYNILDEIARACPSVRKLKLIEKPLTKNGDTLPRCPCEDPCIWSEALKRLEVLEELLFRTSALLVRRAGDWNEEFKLVMSWVNGARRPRSRAHVRPHPKLYHIGIWYGGPAGGGCVTHWSKPYRSQWERAVSIVNPPADHLFI